MAESLTRLKIESIDREEARKGANFLDRAATQEHGGLFVIKANGAQLTAEMPASLLRAMKSILLTLAETGEVLLLSPGIEISPEKAAEILGVPPGFQQACLVPVAYHLGDDFKPADRLPVESFIFKNRWGEPFGAPSPGADPGEGK